MLQALVPHNLLFHLLGYHFELIRTFWRTAFPKSLFTGQNLAWILILQSFVRHLVLLVYLPSHLGMRFLSKQIYKGEIGETPKTSILWKLSII